jgi:DNA-binding NarL/FixJ family response regulator
VSGRFSVPTANRARQIVEIVLVRLLECNLTTRRMAQSFNVVPSTVRTEVKSIYRKLGVCSRGGDPRQGAYLAFTILPIPLGETRWWMMTNHHAVHYARRTLWRVAVRR